MDRNINVSELTVGIVGGRVSYKNGRLYAVSTFAKFIESMAKQYKHVYLSARLRPEHDAEEDYVLPNNITLAPQPNWFSTLDSLKYLPGIRKSYREVIKSSDHMLVRGNPVAATRDFYKLCVKYNKPVCHWLVGNPMALLQSHKRGSSMSNLLGKTYVWMWERQLLKGRKIAKGSLICNGDEIARRYPTEKTHVTVSTTLIPGDFYKRDDTCCHDEIIILSVCYIRPEKGIEYLIEAFAKLKLSQAQATPIKLVLVGERERYSDYQAKLDQLIATHCLEDYVVWLGHVNRTEVSRVMRESDIFVLPSLSEGTPRVLLEARANSLPVIATNVGGIPLSVKNGVDGALVEPKDSSAIYAALHNMLTNDSFRQKLISNGYEFVQSKTVDAFVETLIDTAF